AGEIDRAAGHDEEIQPVVAGPARDAKSAAVEREGADGVGAAGRGAVTEASGVESGAAGDGDTAAGGDGRASAERQGAAVDERAAEVDVGRIGQDQRAGSILRQPADDLVAACRGREAAANIGGSRAVDD